MAWNFCGIYLNLIIIFIFQSEKACFMAQIDFKDKFVGGILLPAMELCDEDRYITFIQNEKLFNF